MFPEKPELVIVIPPKTELLKMVVQLTKHVATINQFLSNDAQQIAVAVDEAMTNVIKHSYKGLNADQNTIHLEFYVVSDGLKIRVIFKGIPPVHHRQPIDLNQMIKNKRKGGLGVELMNRIMDKVEYKTLETTNYCEMIKWKKKESLA